MNRGKDKLESGRNYGIWFAGILILIFPVSSTYLSFSFIYGHGHAERPIVSFLVMFLLGWSGLCLGCCSCCRYGNNPVNLKWIIGVGILARLLFLPSNLILENDCYRYVLDGQMILDGKNPYRHSPEFIKNNLDDILENKNHFQKASLLLSRIGYPEISTIYPPAAQYVFAMGSFLTPWEWFGQRVVFLVFDIGSIFLIVHILRRLNKPPERVIVYAWNPLLLKEIANSAHLDSLVGFFLLLWIITSINWLQNKDHLWLMFAGITFAASILSKLYPLILVPVSISFVILNQKNIKGILLFLCAVCITIVIGYLPFIDVGIDQLTEGLCRYNKEWVQNEGAFYLVQFLCSKLPVSSTLPIDRLVSNSIVGFAAVCLSIKLYLSKQAVSSLIDAIQMTLLVWFLFLPAVFPWYLISLIAISALNPRTWILILSGTAFAYYSFFLISYRDYSENYRYGIQLAEHLIIWVTLMISILNKNAFTRQKEAVV